MSFEKILFYGIIIVGALLLIGLTYYRIDWARHPEKYQDLVEQAEKDEQEAAQRPGHAQAQQEKAEIKAGQGRDFVGNLSPAFYVVIAGPCRRRGSAHKHVFFQPAHGLPHQGMGQGGVDADAVAIAEARAALPDDAMLHAPAAEIIRRDAVAAAPGPAVDEQHIRPLGQHHGDAGIAALQEVPDIPQVPVQHGAQLVHPRHALVAVGPGEGVHGQHVAVVVAGQVSLPLDPAAKPVIINNVVRADEPARLKVLVGA